MSNKNDVVVAFGGYNITQEGTDVAKLTVTFDFHALIPEHSTSFPADKYAEFLRDISEVVTAWSGTGYVGDSFAITGKPR